MAGMKLIVKPPRPLFAMPIPTADVVDVPLDIVDRTAGRC
jgi:hypothetical protein